MDLINLSSDQQECIRQCKETYDFLIGGEGKPEDGIHPIFVDEGAARRCVGLRLGKEEAKPSGSMALMGGEHHYEIAFLPGFQHTLDWWDTLSGAQRASLKGDIYLIFGGDHAQMDKFWEFIEARNEFSPEEYISYRTQSSEYYPTGLNRNRVPKQRELSKNPSEEALFDEQQAIENAFLSKCKIAMSMHSMTGKAPGTFIPYYDYDQWPSPGSIAYGMRLGKLKDQMTELACLAGAETMLVGYNRGVPTMDFVGTSSNNSLRVFFECGGPDFDLDVLNRSKQASQALLHRCFPNLAEKPETTPDSITIYHGTNYLFTPGSPNAKLSTLGFWPADDDLPPGDWDEQMHFLAGNGEEIPEDVRAILVKHGKDIPSGQLGNGQFVPKGQPVAWIRKGGEPVLATNPVAGYAQMAPKKPTYHNGDSTYALTIMAGAQRVNNPSRENVRLYGT